MPQIQKAPLHALQISRHNVRRTNKGDVSELAASILAEGLINPLTCVRVDADGTDERFEVIAGGKRLRAHLFLADRGDISADHLVDINVIDEANALEISLAENVVRERMHPHDEFVAFRDLAANGKGPDEIAARFGVTPLVVQRRLRLANVSPVLLRHFRDNKLSVDQMQAFALTDDHPAQERVYDSARSAYELTPDRIRAALADKQIPTTERRVRFVGLAVYEAAGGAVTRDLFDDTGGGFVVDENLLDQLAEERLCREAETLRAEGWSFVHIERDGEAYKFTSKCDHSHPKREERVLSDEEHARVAALKVRAEDLRQQMEADDALDEHVLTEEAYEALQDERRAALQEIAALTAEVEIYSPRQMAKAGCLIEMGERGDLRISRGLIPRAESKAAQKMVEAAGGTPAAAAPATLSESMLRRFSAHRQLALQIELLQRADIARAALAHALLLPLLFQGAKDRTLDVYAKSNDVGLLGFEDVNVCAARGKLLDAVEGLRSTLRVPTVVTQFWPWLLEQGAETIDALLGLAAVLTVDTVMRYPNEEPKGVPLEVALDLDMSQHWRATATNFGSLVPRAIAIEAVREIHGKEQAARLEPMKKAELAGEVERLVAPFAWLPKSLRRDGYETPKPYASRPVDGAATPKLKPSATRKAAKKTAGKKATTKRPKPAAKKAVKAKPAEKSTPKTRK